MIDEKLDVWLIEVNTNPCLALSSTLLKRLIPDMIEDTFKIVIDKTYNDDIVYERNNGWEFICKLCENEIDDKNKSLNFSKFNNDNKKQIKL